jgi:RNA-directed DNA polymerase
MSGLMATYEWVQLPWRKLEVAVFKLQKRIYKASQAGDVRRVHRLQRLLLKSKAAKWLAVRRVTQDNQGKHTAGVDGIKSLTSQQRLTVAKNLDRLPTGKPTRRIWIPKPGKDEQRPLSIPTLYDRARQALVKQAVEPEWEAKFEPNSYGFRPGRSVHDAIGAIYSAINKQPKYVLDADIAKCFDRIDRNALLRKMGTFPSLQRLIKRWLNAGIIDQGVFSQTDRGTQQGSVISPLLANIALHGLETHLRSHFPRRHQDLPSGTRRPMSWKPQVIRYADDLVVLHRDKTAIEYCHRLTADWLAGIGLELSPAKTRITHTLNPEDGEAGFNFLGFQVRQYPASQYNTQGRGFKTLIKPSKEAIKRHYRQLAETIGRYKTARQENLIRQLNPIIAGWSQYYRAVVSKKVFHTLDQKLYHRLARWARYRHPKKGRQWIAHRYWAATKGRNWVFGTPNGPALNLHAQVAIIRHVKVRGDASPYDGNWTYWAARRGQHPGVPTRMARSLSRQQGRCQAGGLVFTPQALIEIHHLDGDHSNNRYDNLAAIHRHCHDQIHGGYHELSQRIGTHDRSPVN